ncbi:MAG: ABC transporter ATP-binding protein [Gemmataceae bacterium]
MAESPPAIAVTELSFAYPGGKPVLNRLTFDVAPGETVGLVGPNGAGKTTLFLCLAGVLPYRAGRIHLCGLDPANKAQRRELARHVGIVFQNSDDQLFATTVADDVAFGPLNLELPRDEIERRVRDALERVRLTGFEERAPHHLSGGEKRRAALAGVLAMRPSVLLLDEPTMFLDPRGRRELIALLRELGGTRLVASHDLDLILDLCPRTLLLDAGGLVAAGPTAALLGDGALMERHGLETPWRLRGLSGELE